jgi:lipid-binding SYLF domain-containing protein
MKTLSGPGRTLLLIVTVFVSAWFSATVAATTAQQIDRDADAALARLYETVPSAKAMAAKAKGILIFPSIVKAGLMIGGQYGEGVLRQQGKSTGYYSSSAISYGLQAGAQTFGYVMFLMTDGALDYLGKSDGWEVGVGPSIVVMDEGMATSKSTSTLKDDIYAYIFGQ